MKPLKVLCVVLALALLGMSFRPPLEMGASPVTSATPMPVEAGDYAAREAAAPDTAGFNGGFHEVAGFIIFVALVVWVLDLLFLVPHHHYHHPRHHPRVHP